jgi:hypothetical protein
MAYSKYGFEHATVGSHYDVLNSDPFSAMNRVRSASIAYCAKYAPNWRFGVTTNKDENGTVVGYRVTRLEDRDAPLKDNKLYVETEVDKRGQPHRKYDFAKLTEVGKTVIIKTDKPKKHRRSAQAAGWQWAKMRELDWRFKVTINKAETHITIERIK